MVVSACHCDRRGIGPHFHSLPDGCPVVPVLVKPPCAHGRVDEPCERCWAKGCAWYYAYGCICGEDDPAELERIAAAGSGGERLASGSERRTSRAEFEAYLDRQFAAIKAINSTKGRDYTGDEDALANLRDMPRAGITGLQKLWVYLDKHIRAIETYVREGQVESEPIEGRIHDAVLYLLLFGALVEEEQREQDGAAPEQRRAAS